MDIKNITLRTKLITSFSIVIVLLTIVAIVGFTALMRASSGFKQYREMARDSNLAAHLQADMLMMRMNVKDFIITGSDKDLKQYDHYLMKMHEFLEEAKKEIQNPERAEKIAFIDKEVSVYQNAFKKVIEHKKQRNHLFYDVLSVDGPIMEKNLTKIMTSAEEDRDIEAAFHAGLAIRSLLLARLYVTKFMDSNDPKDAQRVEAEFKQLDHEIEELDQRLQNPDRRKQLKIVNDADHEYHEAFKELVTLIVARNEIISGTLDRIGPEIANSVEEVKLSIKGVQDEIGPRLQASNERAETLIVVVSVFALLAGVTLVFFIIRGVSAQLGGDPSEIAEVAIGIAQGNLAMDFKHQKNKAPTGVYRDMEEMANNLRNMFTDINTGIETLTSSASELSAISSQMSDGAQEVTQKSETVSAAAEEMNANMSSVAAAMEQSSANTNAVSSSAEEMSATIGEIAQNTEKAQSVSGDAAQKAAGASVNMDQLGNAANDIGKVIETITDISEQVNLLALNATIEAARAGDAGKGFAVVANEIKDLAKQTADATQDIKSKIEGIQGTTATTVDQITEITTVINDVNDVVSNIAASVQQQSVATKEIATNVAQASLGIQEVNENVNQGSSVSGEISRDIAEVNMSMNDMANSSSQVNLSAEKLTELSDNLKQMMTQFKI